MNNIFKTLILGAGLLTMLTAKAQEVERPIKEEGKKVPKFVRIDANKDGKLSLVEYREFRIKARAKKGKEPKKGDFSKRFKQIDINKDGFLSREEFKNRKETRPPKKQEIR